MSDVYASGDRAAEGAYNQAMFRAVNERIRAILDDPLVSSAFGSIELDPEWVCECANPGCMQRVAIRNDAYLAIRRHPARFLVFAGDGHVFFDIEEVTERHATYWIVEKTGRARSVAQEFAETI
jgi:hypothetical protein